MVAAADPSFITSDDSRFDGWVVSATDWSKKSSFSSLLQFAVYTEIGNAHLQVERKHVTQVLMLMLLFLAIS